MDVIKYDLSKETLNEDSYECVLAFDQVEIEDHEISIVNAMQRALNEGAFGSYDDFIDNCETQEYMYRVAEFNYCLIEELGFKRDEMNIAQLCQKFPNIQPVVLALNQKSYRENIYLCLEFFRSRLLAKQ